ncbi:MAG: tetratricopeptide repeat protein [Myxococcota bacterium]
MSDFHLEALRDRELAGTLDAEGKARLEEHRRSCRACRLEAAVEAEGLAERDDRAMLDRIYATVAAEPEPWAHRPEQRPGSGVRRRVRGGIAAAAILVGASAAAAAVPSVRDAVVEVFEPEEMAVEARAPKQAPAATAVERPARDLPEDPPLEEAVPEEAVPEEAVPEEAVPEEAVPEETVSEETVPWRPERLEPVLLDEAALFEQAREERRAGRIVPAVRLYRELQRRFPGTRRAAVSRISLGELLLGPLGDPAAALREFDAYLARAPRGRLAEQAIVGRARSLGQLGRSAEERRAWQTLLEHYPDSLHADRARRRLGQ